MMQYIIVKVIVKIASCEYDVHYGKVFDNEIDAIREAEKLNQLTRKNDWADLVQYMVLPKAAN